MILKGLKRRSNQNFLTRNYDAFNRNTLKKAPNDIRSVLFISDEDSDLNAVFKSLKTFISPESAKITPLIYSEKKDIDLPSEFLINRKHFGWNGRINEGYLKEVLTNQYDLLINQCKIENLYTDLLVLQAKAALKVGFGSLQRGHYDLLIQCDSSDADLCTGELKKYLEILK